MSIDFGWWNRDPEEGKYEVWAIIHGGNLTFKRKQGHHTQWQIHPPSQEDFDRLLNEAGRRVPRRLISPKQMAEIERIVARDREG